MTKQKLRIGLLLESCSVASWKFKMIENIILSNHSQICLAIIKNPKIESEKSSLYALSNIKHLFYNVYLKFEAKFFKPSPNAFSEKDLKSILSCDELLLNNNSSTNFKFSNNEINKIENYNIDVLINLDINPSIDESLKIAGFGVWSLNHGNKILNNAMPGIWEVLKYEEETASSLKISLKNNEETLIAIESFSHTDHISFNRNRNNFYWKTSSFIPRKLKELHLLGHNEFFKNINHTKPQPNINSDVEFNIPSNSEMLIGLIKNYYKSIKIHIRNYFYFDQWTLLFKFSKDNSLSNTFTEFIRLTPPKDRFWADPFILERDSKYYIFLEELLYKDKRGKLAVMELNENGETTAPKTILDKNYHLSYPFLIEHNDHLYMIPETKGNSTIDIYKCTNFPYHWEFEKHIFKNIQAVDSTIYKYNNKFWLFTNIKENDGASAYDELFLFYSEDLLSDEWEPHPMNPIISDVKCARPAGNIFKHEGRIFRPAQNCAKHYGYGMQIREIITLNEQVYEEKQIQSIYPDWNKDLVSTHTFNHSGRLTIIDALVRRKK